MKIYAFRNNGRKAGRRNPWAWLAGGIGAAVLMACTGAGLSADTPPLPAPPKPSALGSASADPSFGDYLAGRYAYATHDIPSAGEYLLRALTNDPDNRSLLQRTLALLIADGRMDESVSLARRLVALDPESKIGQLLLLTDEIESGRFHAAESRASQISLEGIYVVLLPLMEAWIEFGRGDITAALDALRPIAERKAYEPYYAFHAALINELAGRSVEADRHYKAAIVALPGGTQRLVGAYGAFLELEGRTDDARAVYDTYKSNNPESIWLEPVLERLAAGGEPVRAVTSASDGVAEALFGAASALPQDGGDAGLLYARLALHLRPNFPVAQLLVGEIMESVDRTTDAVEAYRKVERASPFYWTARLRANSNLARLKRTEEAAEELKRMVVERPDRSDAALTLGDVMRMEQRYEEAVEAYETAIDRTPLIEPRHWSLFYARGVALERIKEWARAEADLLHALELQPEQPLVLNYLGYSWVEQGINLDRARGMIERAVELRPNDGYIVDSLGWVLYRLGDIEGAVANMERAVELRSDDPVINDHLGDVYWEAGRRIEAKFQWQRALTLGAEEEDAAAIRRKLVRGLTAEAMPENAE